jgi:hypothetical protein
MSTTEISSTNWSELCHRLTDALKGRRVSVEVLGTGGKPVRVASGLALQELIFEKTEQCSDHLFVLLGENNRVTHQIIEPIHMKVREEDRSKVLQIDAESGTTLVRFQADDLSRVFEGLKLIDPRAAGSAISRGALRTPHGS